MTQQTERLGVVISFAALVTAAATIALVPWFLGGAIPQARVVLQSGAIAGAVMAMVGGLLSRQGLSRLPFTSLPFLGISCLGLLQLMPIYVSPLLQMQHAAEADLVTVVLAAQDSTAQTHQSVRSVMPSETRQYVAVSLSLALMAMTLFEVTRTRRDVVWAAGPLVMSACLMTGLALSQQFANADVTVGNHWKVSPTKPFGCFVNPNNAAGWLMICASAAMLLCGLCFEQRWRYTELETPAARARSGRTVNQFWRSLLRRIADLTSSQILTASATVLLMAGIAATLSRAGILAGVLGMAAFLMSRSRSGRFFWALVILSLILVLCGSFLALLELDTLIISELQTLKDPVSDSTGRILHWSDSLASWFDFPLIGSGLGAYRYASLPYQKHFTGKWFQRADNQYVEVLVESGLFGLVCFFAVGFVALRCVRQGLSREKIPGVRSRLLMGWLSSAVLCCVVSIAAAAFFDYGISLPSVSAAFVLLVAVLERQVHTSESVPFHRSSTNSSALSGPSILSLGSILSVWIALLVASAALLPDTINAARLYSVTASIERQIRNPDVEWLTKTGDESLLELNTVLAARPDDVLAQRTRCLFLELLVRRDFFSLFTEGRVLTPAQRDNEFRSVQIAGLADQVMDQKLAADLRTRIRGEAERILRENAWPKSLDFALKQSPCVLSLASKRALSHFLLGDIAAAINASTHSRFTEPHGADTLYVMGRLMLRAGQIDDCRRCWSQSISASESYRPTIMLELAEQRGMSEALEWFLPNSYESCVKSAERMPSSQPLRGILLDRAAEIWDAAPPRLTESIILTRSQHLYLTGGEKDAVLWLDTALERTPQNVTLRKSKARLLEKLGLNSEAYDEWLRIQSFDATDPEPEIALERLIRLPPTTAP